MVRRVSGLHECTIKTTARWKDKVAKGNYLISELTKNGRGGKGKREKGPEHFLSRRRQKN